MKLHKYWESINKINHGLWKIISNYLIFFLVHVDNKTPASHRSEFISFGEHNSTNSTTQRVIYFTNYKLELEPISYRKKPDCRSQILLNARKFFHILIELRFSLLPAKRTLEYFKYSKGWLMSKRGASQKGV